MADEVRGAWVTAWTPGFYTPEQCDKTIAAAESANLNTLLVQVRKNADAYYNSDIEPRGSNLQPGFDPLSYIIEKAHKRGIKVYAWINTFRVWASKASLPSDPNHIVNRHPDWLNHNYKGELYASEGIYLDPGVPEARDYIVSVVRDIASRYDLDGIHMDYIRYPESDWGYSDAALKHYYDETGASSKPKPSDPAWMQWRRDQVTATIKSISNTVHSVKPPMAVSAATIPWGKCDNDFCQTSPYKQVYQDWKKWLAEGILDAHMPMDYRIESKPRYALQFREWLDGFKRWSGGKHVYVGIDVSNNTDSDVIKQINAVRNKGLDGFILFSFNQSAERNRLVAALEKSNLGNVKTVSSVSESQHAFEIGIKYAMKNQLGLAEVYLKRALENDPNNSEAAFRLGRVYLREHNQSMAEQYFETALDINPNYAAAKKELDKIKN